MAHSLAIRVTDRLAERLERLSRELERTPLGDLTPEAVAALALGQGVEALEALAGEQGRASGPLSAP